jgi:hypothetical protein
MLYTILYLSKARKAFNAHELTILLNQSRIWNNDHRLTGFLAYVSGTVQNKVSSQFIQVLEGDKAEVIDIFSHIQIDNRHNDIKVIKQGFITHRKFSLWKMGFQIFNLNDSALLQQFFSMDASILAEDGDLESNVLMSFMKSFYETGD